MPNTSGINRSNSNSVNNEQDLNRLFENAGTSNTSSADDVDLSSSEGISADFQQQLTSLGQGRISEDTPDDSELLSTIDDFNEPTGADFLTEDSPQGSTSNLKQEIEDLKSQVEESKFLANQKEDLLSKLQKASASIEIHKADKANNFVENVKQSIDIYKTYSKVTTLKEKNIISDQNAQKYFGKLNTLLNNIGKTNKSGSSPNLEDINSDLEKYPVDANTGEPLFAEENPLSGLTALISPKPSASAVFKKIQTCFPDLGITSMDDLQQKMDAKLFPPSIPNAQVLNFMKEIDPTLKTQSDKLGELGKKGYIEGYYTDVGNADLNWSARGNNEFLAQQTVVMDRLTTVLNAFYSGAGSFSLPHPISTNPQARNCIDYKGSSSSTALHLAAFQVAGHWGLDGGADERVTRDHKYTNKHASEAFMSTAPYSALNKDSKNIEGWTTSVSITGEHSYREID